MFLIDRVSKSYGANAVLVNASLEIEKGQLVVISGDNGSGKTTLLKIAATLLTPDEGNVGIKDEDGHTLVRSDNIRKFISYVSHSSFLYDNLTLNENLKLFAKLMKLGSKDEGWVDLLDRFNILQFQNAKVRELSHGTKKKVSLCRSLMQPARLMIWDEPDSGLDDSSTRTLSEIIKGQIQKGISVLLTSHNQSFVDTLECDAFRLQSGSLRFKS